MFNMKNATFTIDKNFTVISALEKCKEVIRELRSGGWTAGDILERAANHFGVWLGDVISLSGEVVCNNTFDSPIVWFDIYSVASMKDIYHVRFVMDLDGNVHGNVCELDHYTLED